MNLFTLMGKIAVDNSEANKGIDDTTKKASGASSSIGGSLSKIGTTVSNMGKTVSNAGQYVQDFSSNMLSWGKSGATGKAAVAGLASVTALLGSSIPAAIKRLDTLNNSSKVFANMGFSAKDTSKAMTYLQDGIKGLPTPLNDAVTGLQMISSATNNVQVGAQVFTAMNHAILGFGGSTDQVSNATIQLSQALSNGKIDAQTWNSMMQSQMGPTLNAMAKQMGITTGALKEGLSSGKISVSDFEKALTDLDQKGGGGLKSLKQIAADNMGGIGTGFANMRTAVTRGMADILAAIGSTNISSAISNFGTSMEQALNGVSNSIKVVVGYVQANSSWLMPIIKGAAGAVGGLIALKGAAILLTPVISTLGGGIKILGGIITVLTSPIGLVVGALFLIGTAFYAFLTKTQEGRNVMVALVDVFNTSVIPVLNNVKNAISNAMNGAVGTISKSGSIINGVMQSIANFISAHWDQISVAIGIAMDIIGAVISQGMQLWQTLIVPVITTIVSFIRDNWGNIKTIIMTVLVIVGAVIAAAMFAWQNAIFPALLAIANTVALVFNNIMGVISGILNLIVGIINLFINIFTGNWRAAFYSLGDIMDAAWQIFINVFMGLLNGLVGIFQATWALIQTGVNAFFGIVASIMTAGWNLVTSIISGLLNVIKAVISGIWNGIVFVIKGAITLVTSFIQMEITGWTIIISAVMNGIKNVFVNTWNGIKTVVTVVVSAVASVITSVWNAIRNTTSAVFNDIRSVASSVWNGIRSTISGVVNGISSTISGVWNGIRSVTSSVWNGIKNAMTSPIQAAVGVVRGIINTIKSLFNFHISFPAIKIPHIPLPHFSVSGGFDLKQWAKGKGFPSLSVDWFAKGGLMTSPTMFGMNGNNAMVGGEAGDEAILPLENQSVISRIAGAITDKMKPATDTDKNVEVNQYITMPATETPREYAKRTTQEFVKVFKKA